MTSAFERLHPDIKRVLWDMKWESLRDLQVDAINSWFDKTVDLILMANTASGKTEAAFLPILSMLAPDRGGGSVRALYVGPLKALINDQFRRIEDLCKRAEIPVYRWHGDVGANKKHELLNTPAGMLLITPESLEALLMRRGREVRRVFSKLEAIVIDEMHCFLDSERGRQLCSQMRRIDAIRADLPSARRIGLSATIGDTERAKHWLQRVGAALPEVIESSAARSIELVIKTFVHERPSPKVPSVARIHGVEGVDLESDGEPDIDEEAGWLSIAQHIYENMRGATNLVFCNRKADIEVLADVLQVLCERHKQPNEFLVHHGSLSKQIREFGESELQSGRPCTAICSSTLELGIDVGYVDSVGQIEPPHSVSALKQRLGRSGRRAGQPSRLWLYVPVRRRSGKDPLPDRLYPPVLQAISMVELMLEKWVEPPLVVSEDFSTLIQQTLSHIVERGGVNAADAHALLCGSPAFSAVDPPLYGQLLKDLGKADLLSQAKNGDLILGLEGERLTGHYDFYAAFASPDEYDILEGSRHIGSLEVVAGMYKPGDNILLAAKRWKITDIDDERQVILVKRTRDRKPPLWRRGGGHIHHRIREKMLDLLLRSTTPVWVNPASAEVLAWAREAASEATLAKRRWVEELGETFVFTWTGSKGQFTLLLWLRANGIELADHGIALGTSSGMAEVKAVLSQLLNSKPQGEDIVRKAFPEEIPPVGKHGCYLSNELRARAFASQLLDVPEALECANSLLSSE